MIQGRSSSGERIRMFIGKRAGYTKSQMFSDSCHPGYKEERIVHRNLNPAMNRGVGLALIDVIRAEDVGKKQTVKFTALQ
jgi:hypothetical protein